MDRYPIQFSITLRADDVNCTQPCCDDGGSNLYRADTDTDAHATLASPTAADVQFAAKF